MNALEWLLADRKVVVYTTGNGMVGKAICNRKEVASHVAEISAVAGPVNVRIVPYRA